MSFADVEATDGPDRNVIDTSSLEGPLESWNRITGCNPTPADGHLVAKCEQPWWGSLLDRFLEVGAVAGDGAATVVDAHRRNAPASARRAALVE